MDAKNFTMIKSNKKRLSLLRSSFSKLESVLEDIKALSQRNSNGEKSFTNSNGNSCDVNSGISHEESVKKTYGKWPDNSQQIQSERGTFSVVENRSNLNLEAVNGYPTFGSITPSSSESTNIQNEHFHLPNEKPYCKGEGYPTFGSMTIDNSTEKKNVGNGEELGYMPTVERYDNTILSLSSQSINVQNDSFHRPNEKSHGSLLQNNQQIHSGHSIVNVLDPNDCFSNPVYSRTLYDSDQSGYMPTVERYDNTILCLSSQSINIQNDSFHRPNEKSHGSLLQNNQQIHSIANVLDPNDCFSNPVYSRTLYDSDQSGYMPTVERYDNTILSLSSQSINVQSDSFHRPNEKSHGSLLQNNQQIHSGHSIVNVINELEVTPTHTKNQVMEIDLPNDSTFLESRLKLMLNNNSINKETSLTNYLYYLYDGNNVDYNWDSTTDVDIDFLDSAETMDDMVEQNHTPNVEVDVELMYFETFTLDATIEPIKSSSRSVTPVKTNTASNTFILPNNSTSKHLSSSINKSVKPFTVNIEPRKGCDNTNMFILTKEEGPKVKKLCCVFCLKRYSKLVRHLHQNEEEVKAFRDLIPGSKERRCIIERIRKRGQFEWNTNVEINGGELMPSRRPTNKNKKKAHQLKSCANCYASIFEATLRQHWNKCTANSLKHERVVKTLARAVEGRLHVDACFELRTLIFPPMREDDCVQIIRFDWLLIIYGNNMCLNYSPHYQHDLIRKKLREAGKILVAARSICPQITDFASLFHVKYCNTVIEAIRKVAKFDTTLKTFKSPSTAATSVTLINTIGELLLVESMELEHFENENNVARFNFVFQRRVRLQINKIVAVQKTKRLRKRKENIPSIKDINLLCEYLDRQRDEICTKLSRMYSYDDWVYLAQLTLASIIVFNRRRTGEVRNVLVSEFIEREIIAECNEPVLDPTALENAKQLIKSRMKIRGKLNRTVPVLLKHSVDKCMELLLLHREEAGVPKGNEFFFALPGQSGFVRTVNACVVIRNVSNLCGAQNPTSLRGTNLRKHFASFCSTLGLTDNDVTNVATHMGHSDQMHRDVYRHNPLQREIVQMTELLEVAQGKKGISAATTRANISQVGEKPVRAIATKTARKRKISDDSISGSTAKKRKNKQGNKKQNK